jgi:acetyl-CoA C-acetyltransferase
MSRDKAKELGLEPMATLRAWASGDRPKIHGTRARAGGEKGVQEDGSWNKDLDVIELNEAFAAQMLGCMKELGWDSDHVNPHGSGISMGHPIGCTGARNSSHHHLRYGAEKSAS